MSAEDLKVWLEEPGSEQSGWQKADGSGETVGHESYVFLSSIASYLLLTETVLEKSLQY